MGPVVVRTLLLSSFSYGEKLDQFYVVFNTDHIFSFSMHVSIVDLHIILGSM